MFSDTICPWCYIGFNQLNQTLENFNNYNFDIVWRPFQLNPDMPLEGIDRQQYLTAKFGGEDNARSVYQRIEDEGKKNKIYFQFNKIAKTPNSFFSHKLLAFAHRKKKQTEVLELLFYKYFIEGEDIGSLDVLIRLSQDADIYDEHIEKYLISKEDNESLLNEEKQAKNIGINSVPCFIFNKEIVVNGAQSMKNFIQIINSLNNNV
ncbi:DsbA family oxidoreductase [Alphaproteobacteria bacterium]|nr:DsbA family oxidoreductase [Alphaproteobacteria bacterium]MDC3270085.1 DsbA family oxidoreductase [Alphaproteobacteria bacterium]